MYVLLLYVLLQVRDNPHLRTFLAALLRIGSKLLQQNLKAMAFESMSRLGAVRARLHVDKLILQYQRACIREKDWRYRARVSPARSPWRAHVTCVPRLRQRQSFSRMLLSQKSKTSRITSPKYDTVGYLSF